MAGIRGKAKKAIIGKNTLLIRWGYFRIFSGNLFYPIFGKEIKKKRNLHYKE